jgi:hypothetical protein
MHEALTNDFAWSTASDIAAGVASGQVSASRVIEAAIMRICKCDAEIVHSRR